MGEYEVWTSATLDDQPLAVFDTASEAVEFAASFGDDSLRSYLVYQGNRRLCEYYLGVELCE